jgi:hypothetical protein
MLANFIPEIWSAQILETLRTRLVYGGPGVVNRDYEGDIAEAGDTVHITSFTDPTIRTYTSESNITVDSISDATRALVVDQAKYFAFEVESVSSRSGYLLAQTADDFLADTMYAAVNGTANDLGAKVADISDNSAYGILVDFWSTLTRDDCPLEGRWVVVPPEFYAALLQDNRFIDASASGSTDALRNGFVGRAAGFDIFVSNSTPDPTAGTYAVIGGHPMATTYAEQINQVAAQERELRFGQLVKGLHLYGAKVVRPTCLVMASVTVQA